MTKTLTMGLFVLVTLSASGCLEMAQGAASGGQAFGNHPLGPNPGGQTAQRCLVNTQSGAVGNNPYAYQTGYATCR